jgi:hypothetical protein
VPATVPSGSGQAGALARSARPCNGHFAPLSRGPTGPVSPPAWGRSAAPRAARSPPP